MRIIKFVNKLNTFYNIKKNKFDVIHPTYYDPYVIKYANNVPLVITIHDMIHEKFPEYFNKYDTTSKNKKKYLLKSNAIITVSQKTKEDLLYFYPQIPEKKIFVIYHGNELSSSGQINKKENYILFIGQRNGYKNFERFIKAVAPILIRFNLRLICIGPLFTQNEYRILKQNNITDRAISTFISESDLQDIYAKALVFVFPSLYEGFGFPILEAFASGCPVILSCTSCFQEIAEDAAVYFDPYSIDDMRETIEKVLLNGLLQTKLVEKGYKRIRFFSWEKTVKQTYQIYSEIL